MVSFDMSGWSLFAAAFLFVLALVMLAAGLVVAAFGKDKSRVFGLVNVLIGWFVLFVFWYMYWNWTVVLVILIVLVSAVLALAVAAVLLLGLLMKS